MKSAAHDQPPSRARLDIASIVCRIASAAFAVAMSACGVGSPNPIDGIDHTVTIADGQQVEFDLEAGVYSVFMMSDQQTFDLQWIAPISGQGFDCFSSQDNTSVSSTCTLPGPGGLIVRNPVTAGGGGPAAVRIVVVRRAQFPPG